MTVTSLSVDPDLNRLYVKATGGGATNYLFAKDNVALDQISMPPATLAALVLAEIVAYLAAVAKLANQAIVVANLPDTPTVTFGAAPVTNPGYGQVSITATVYSTSFTITMSTQSFLDWSLMTTPPFTQRVAQILALLAKQSLTGVMSGYTGGF
jgi:hypothetical protein